MQITDIFDYANEDGSVRAYEINEMSTATNKLYILNKYGKKIIQLIVNDEKNKANEYFAQIKIIPYDIKIIKDINNLTETNKRFRNAEITYHGSQDLSKSAKIHLKYSQEDNCKYETIIDNSCIIPQNSLIPIPLFSIRLGNLYNNKKKDNLKNKSKSYSILNNKTAKLDFYIVGSGFDIETYANSMYSFNMFFSLDYLIEKNNHPLNYAFILQPIEIYKMKNYTIFIRCSLDKYDKQPNFLFYNNQNFYNIFLNREMMYLNSDGMAGRKINMKDKEKELVNASPRSHALRGNA